MKYVTQHAAITCILILRTTTFANLTRRLIDDDYYGNYDYDLSNNNSENVQLKPDSFILPNPETIEAKYEVDSLPKIELPDDSLADTDLRDHDLIDNLMYVYYGSRNNKVTYNYHREIIMIGSILSCAIQLFTILIVLLKKANTNGKKEVKAVFLHLMCCLCLSNLLFLMGVFATKSQLKCQIIAVLLHYSHLIPAFWIFLYSQYIYKKLFALTQQSIQYMSAIAYGLSAVLSLVAFILTPSNYEMKKFCFISVQKGMISNYMLPVSLLLILTTIYSLNGIRKINFELSKLELTNSVESLNGIKAELDRIKGNKHADTLHESEILTLKENKCCLKGLCAFQASYDIVWFTSVLALENIDYTNAMAIIFLVATCSLYVYICAMFKTFLPSMRNTCHAIIESEQVVGCDQEKSLLSKSSRNNSSDTIPLLVNAENCTEMRELHLEHISTISG